MSDLPRRGSLPRVLSQARFGLRPNMSENSIDTTEVLSSSALPQVFPYIMPERSLDVPLGTPSKGSKHSPPSSPCGREPAPGQDSFRAISRAIHNVKIRTGARLSALAAKQRLARSTMRNHVLYMRAASATRAVFFLMLFVLATSVLLRVYGSESNSPFFIKRLLRDVFHLFGNQASKKKHIALKQMLQHRPSSITTRHFETGPWVIGAITDQDKESCRYQERLDSPIRTAPCGKANTWISYFKRGILRINVPLEGQRLAREASGNSIEWLDEVELYRHGNIDVELEGRLHGGRGMELSELEWFYGHMLSPDDRTGILLEIVSPRGQLDTRSQQEFYGEPSNIAPSIMRRATLLDGPGNDTTAFFKAEWMVVKEDHLIVGGHGRSYTDPSDGTRIKSNDPKWVKVVDFNFNVSHEDWSARYDAIAKAAGVSFPGYLMHEAVLWSDLRKQWIFLPRRRSKAPFTAVENERRGWNFVVVASEDFTSISAVEIEGLHDPSGLRGFSSAKFVPGTSDRIIAAIRTVELEAGSTSEGHRETSSFLSVFDVENGTMLLREQKFSSKKFEGLVFL